MRFGREHFGSGTVAVSFASAACELCVSSPAAVLPLSCAPGPSAPRTSAAIINATNDAVVFFIGRLSGAGCTSVV